MSIQKKSLISTLKTTKKANVAKEEFSQVGTSAASVKSPARRQLAKRQLATKQLAKRQLAKRQLAKRSIG